MPRAAFSFCLALVLIAVALVVQLATAGPSKVDPSALSAYQSRLLPLVTAGGRTIEQGVKPAMADLRSRHVVPPAMIASEATTWISDLTRVRSEVARLRVGGRLQRLNRSFLEALDGYLLACRTFRSAASTMAVTARTALIDKGINQAVTADQLYDRAAGQLQTIRRELHLAPDSSFPQPTGGHQT